MPERPEPDLHRERRFRSIAGAVLLLVIVSFLTWYIATNWRRDGTEPATIVGMAAATNSYHASSSG